MASYLCTDEENEIANICTDGRPAQKDTGDLSDTKEVGRKEKGPRRKEREPFQVVSVTSDLQVYGVRGASEGDTKE